MWLSRAPTPLDVRTRLSPSDVRARLVDGVANVRSVVWSPALGRAEPFVGAVGDRDVALRVRHPYSNGLTRIFYGEIVEEPDGAVLRGEFRTLLWVVLVMRACWILVALFPVYFLARANSPLRFASFGFLIVIAFLVAIEAWARRLGDADEDTLRRHLTKVFANARR